MAVVVLALGKPMLMLFGPGFDSRLSRCCSCWSSASSRALRSGPAESLLTMSGNQNICAAVYALTLALNIDAQRAADPASRPVGRGDRHRRLDGVRGGGALLHRLAQARHRHGDLRARRRSAEGAALMAAVPLLEEMSGGPAGADDRRARRPGRPRRSIRRMSSSWRATGRRAGSPSIRPRAGFDLVEELDYLCTRTIEPNVFFNPRFLAPAMPRLEDREVRLAVIRDGDEYKNRLRLLVPFSVERPADPARRLDHAHLVEPVRPARHAAGRPRRSGRRHRGLLRHAVAPASQAAEGARAARNAARRRRSRAC